MRQLWIVATLLLALAAGAEEKLLKPLPSPGSGEPVEGLRASITMVKNDFGPGESIMVVWKLTNEGKQPVTLKLGRNHVFDFAFETHRDSKEVNTARLDFQDYFSPQISLEAGESVTRMIDLRSIHVADRKWCEPLGRYEVAVTYVPKRIKSGTAQFRVTVPGENAPEIAPEMAERIRSLIAQLGADEFRKREEAYKELLVIGKPALRQLQEAAEAKADPEIATRCQKLVAEIRQRLNPRPLPPQPPLPPVPPPPPPPPPLPPPDDDF